MPTYEPKARGSKVEIDQEVGVNHNEETWLPWPPKNMATIRHKVVSKRTRKQKKKDKAPNRE